MTHIKIFMASKATEVKRSIINKKCIRVPFHCTNANFKTVNIYLLSERIQHNCLFIPYNQR